MTKDPLTTEQMIDELVRDYCAAGVRVKSEIRRRLQKLVEQAKKEDNMTTEEQLKEDEAWKEDFKIRFSITHNQNPEGRIGGKLTHDIIEFISRLTREVEERYKKESDELSDKCEELERQVHLAYESGKREAEDATLTKAINLIKAPRHCLVQSCVRCEEQERAINILKALKTNKNDDEDKN